MSNWPNQWYDGKEWHHGEYPRGKWVGEGTGFVFKLRPEQEPNWLQRWAWAVFFNVKWRRRRDDE